MNNIDFATLTREEAVLCLMNMKTSQVNMIVANLRHGLFNYFLSTNRSVLFSSSLINRLRTITC